MRTKFSKIVRQPTTNHHETRLLLRILTGCKFSIMSDQVPETKERTQCARDTGRSQSKQCYTDLL